MDDCLLQEVEKAKQWGKDLTSYPARNERCRWDQDMDSCEICRNDGLLPAQDCLVKVYTLGVRS